LIYTGSGPISQTMRRVKTNTTDNLAKLNADNRPVPRFPLVCVRRAADLHGHREGERRWSNRVSPHCWHRSAIALQRTESFQPEIPWALGRYNGEGGSSAPSRQWITSVRFGARTWPISRRARGLGSAGPFGVTA
jgi:hypothetical protein